MDEPVAERNDTRRITDTRVNFRARLDRFFQRLADDLQTGVLPLTEASDR